MEVKVTSKGKKYRYDNKVLVATYIDKEIFDKLKELCKENDRSMSSMVRFLIKKEYENDRTHWLL